MSREYLTPKEIDLLLAQTKHNRYPQRDHLIILLMYRHGFRASELAALTLKDLDLATGQLHIHRLKNGLSTNHPLHADEIRLLKAYLRDRASDLSYIFVSERGPFTRFGIYQLVKSLGKATGIPDLHPHTIRHSTGYALANKGLDTRLIQDYLGHRDIQSTVRYTRVNHERFRNIWR